MFMEFIKLLKLWKYAIVYIDEVAFNTSNLPLHTWSEKGKDAPKLIRKTNDRYNAIAAQVGKYKMFHIKKDTTKSINYIVFLKNLMKELKKLIGKNQFEYRTVIVCDNASIHITDDVHKFLKQKGIKCFTIPPYAPELNNIEHTFGVLKKKLACRNLVNKDFLHVIKETVQEM